MGFGWGEYADLKLSKNSLLASDRRSEPIINLTHGHALYIVLLF